LTRIQGVTKGQAAVSVMGIEERRKRGDSEANAGYAGPKWHNCWFYTVLQRSLLLPKK